MRKQRLGLLAAVLLTFAGISGACSGGQDASPEAKQAKDAYEVRVKQTAPDSALQRPEATEQRLERLAEGIPEVKHANCVIVGDRAIVGIDVSGTLDRSRVGTIKYAVAEVLKKDPVGIDAVVTADMDLYHRLQEIRQDAANGKPMQGIAEELADIVGRIIPQLPRDTEDREEVPPQPKATTQEKGVKKSDQVKNGEMDSTKTNDPENNRSFSDHPSNR